MQKINSLGSEVDVYEIDSPECDFEVDRSKLLDSVRFVSRGIPRKHVSIDLCFLHLEFDCEDISLAGTDKISLFFSKIPVPKSKRNIIENGIESGAAVLDSDLAIGLDCLKSEKVGFLLNEHFLELVDPTDKKLVRIKRRCKNSSRLLIKSFLERKIYENNFETILLKEDVVKLLQGKKKHDLVELNVPGVGFYVFQQYVLERSIEPFSGEIKLLCKPSLDQGFCETPIIFTKDQDKLNKGVISMPCRGWV